MIRFSNCGGLFRLQNDWFRIADEMLGHCFLFLLVLLTLYDCLGHVYTLSGDVVFVFSNFAIIPSVTKDLIRLAN